MFRIKTEDVSNLYYVTSSDWESIIVSTSAEKAATEAFEEVYAELEEHTNLSPSIIVVDLTNFSLTFSEEHAKIFPTTLILSDAGLHNLAHKFKKIIPE